MNRILIIEDDVALSNGIVYALIADNCVFVQAYDLATAKEQIKSKSFDLIILDINLPDGNGLELLAEIRETLDLPVIVLTANDMETDIVTGFELGADDYIAKPFSLMVLRARVGVQLRKAKKQLPKTVLIDKFSFSFEKMEFLKNASLLNLARQSRNCYGFW